MMEKSVASSGGGIRVDVLWQILYVTLAVMVFIIIPFAYFFYESDVDPYVECACVPGVICVALYVNIFLEKKVFALIFCTNFSFRFLCSARKLRIGAIRKRRPPSSRLWAFSSSS